MKWWNKQASDNPLRDSDEIYFQVVSTYPLEKFNDGVFDSSLLKQPCLLIQGFFDVLMNGPAAPRIARSSLSVKLNGSAHFPHFEQSGLFVKTVAEFLKDTLP